jgi:hypothetical protein
MRENPKPNQSTIRARMTRQCFTGWIVRGCRCRKGVARRVSVVYTEGVRKMRR